MSTYGHWEYNETFDFSDWFGFVYKITNLKTNKSYIGRKQFSSYIRKKIKNRINRKRIVKESNWKDYTGSNDVLNEELEIGNRENYKFEIIELCKTRRDLTYREAWHQFNSNVLEELLEDGTHAYYNANILNKFFRKS